MALYRLKTLLYRIKLFVRQSQSNGLSLPYIACIHLPRLFITLAYFKVAKTVNDKLLSPTLNQRRFKRFHQDNPPDASGHYYVIVMPNTLHYLIPCLQLIPTEISLFLVFNGAQAWERAKLKALFKNRPCVKLVTLPFSSVNHGPVINLFLHQNHSNFGIIDHDLYIFDEQLLRQRDFTNKQSMRAVFKGVNQISGLTYPHTFFLYFNTQVLKQIMQKYEVDARIYYQVDALTSQTLEKVGLGGGAYIKEYINYFDTLHVILGLSYAQKLEVDYVNTRDVFHLGGTSMGSQYSKDLLHKYMSMRFLEYLNDHELKQHYLPFLAPFSNAEQIWQKLEKNSETIHMRSTLDAILTRLTEARLTL